MSYKGVLRHLKQTCSIIYITLMFYKCWGNLYFQSCTTDKLCQEGLSLGILLTDGEELVLGTAYCSVCVVSHVRLSVTPRTVAHQNPLSMGFSRQEYCSGLPFPSPGGLPHPHVLHWQAESLPLRHLGSSLISWKMKRHWMPWREGGRDPSNMLQSVGLACYRKTLGSSLNTQFPWQTGSSPGWFGKKSKLSSSLKWTTAIEF